MHDVRQALVGNRQHVCVPAALLERGTQSIERDGDAHDFMKAANSSFQSACQRDSAGRFSVMSCAAHWMRSSISRVTSLSGQRM